MKFINNVMLVLLSAVFCFGSMAQDKIDEDAISKMSLSELQAYQKVLRIQKDNSQSPPITVSKLEEYASVGKALGQAFKECWSTVSTDAERFAQSPAGKWTAFLITWKVMGRDAVDLVQMTVRWIVGGFLLLILVPTGIYVFLRNCVFRPVIKTERTGLFKVTKTYAERQDPIHSGEAIMYPIVIAALVALICLVMFV